jgi:hypothetical protein
MMFRNAIRIVGTAAVVLSLGVMGLAQQSAKVDVTGTWAFTIESAAGTGMPIVTFQQEGSKLTGHYSSMFFGEAELTGSIDDRAIEFTVPVQGQDAKVDMKFTGTDESKDSMKGRLSAGNFGDGTFSGTRK